jgi:hypothetical protein
MPIGNPGWLPPQVIVLTQDHMGTNWSYVKTKSCSGSHLGIMINIKNTKFVKDLPMIDAQFRFNQCNSFCSDMNFKMMATAGLSLTLDPMGKVSQNASSLKPLGQFKPNCPGINLKVL